jgi:hypothetical protein
MSNDSTSTPHLWTLDSVGFLKTGPIYVRKVVLIPNAANDEMLFNTWNEDSTVAAGTKKLKTGTITSNSIMTSTGNLTSAVADGYIFRILSSSGAAANVDRHVVETAGNNNAITVHHEDDSWTNEASKVYSWETYTTTRAMYLKAITDASLVQLDFGPKGRKFYNLCLETLTSSAKVDVYLVGSDRE